MNSKVVANPNLEWRTVVYRTLGREVTRVESSPSDRATAVRTAARALLGTGERVDVERYVKGHWTLVARRASHVDGLHSLSVDFAPEVNHA